MISQRDICDAICQVTEAVGPRAVGILMRHPAIDAQFPDASDLEFVVVAEIEEMRSERMRLATPDGARIMADLHWIPWAWVSNPEIAATRGGVAHRLMHSRLVWDSGRGVARHCDEVTRLMYQPHIQSKRVGVFLDSGFESFRHVGRTWDFPSLALFWLHMGHAAYLGAMADGMGRLCPNVYSRPFDYLQHVEQQTQSGLRARWIEALHLQVDPHTLIARLSRIHSRVRRRFSQPAWHENVGEQVRTEYRYWLSQAELDWRIGVALEMIRKGDRPAAVFYLRFCAWEIARLPLVHACAAEGRTISFLCAEVPVLSELRRLIPEIVEDLDLAFADNPNLSTQDVQASVAMLGQFRDKALSSLRATGTPLPSLYAWEARQPRAA